MYIFVYKSSHTYKQKSMIARNKYLFILILFFLNRVNLNAQTWDWLQTIQPGGNEYVWDVTNDKQGNLFATGRVKAYSTFGSGSYTLSPTPISLYETDMFIVKYRPNGDLAWVKRDGSKQPDWGRAVACDGQGNVFVAGDYCDTATFGSYQLIAKGTYQNRNAFFAKYDSSGTCLWAKSAGNVIGYSKGYGVTTDASGNSYFTGYITGVVTIDNVTFGSGTNPLCFVAKFDPNGNCIWGIIIPGTYGSEGNDITIDKNGDLLVTGDYNGTLYIYATAYPGNSPSYGDVFLVKMNTAGTFIWAKTAIGAYQDQGNTIGTDINGNIYIGGTFANDLSFGTTTINSVGWGTDATTANAGADAFLTKYNKDGIFQWVKTYANKPSAAISEMAVTPSNKILVSGTLVGNTNMAGIPIIADSIYNTFFVTAFDTTGNVLWYKLNGGNANSQISGNAVSSDSHGNCFTGGELMGSSISFDNTTYSSYNGWDGYIAKLFPPLNPFISVDYTTICPAQNANFSVIQDGYPLTYQWNFPGGTPASSLIINPVINYPVAGTYTVTLLVGNGHTTSTTSLTINVTPGACTSVPTYVNTINISIAPNPASSIATIHINGLNFNDPISLHLYNYLGQEVETPLPIRDSTFILNLETIPPGSYFFNIVQNNSVIKTEKLIVLGRQ